MVRRTARRVQANHAVDHGTLVHDFADGGVFVSERGDRGDALGGMRGECVPQGVFGLTKLAPGRCRPMISMIIWLVFAVP